MFYISLGVGSTAAIAPSDVPKINSSQLKGAGSLGVYVALVKSEFMRS